MTWIDYVIIGIIALSILIGLVRGFLREVLSFITLLGALFIAWTFYKEFADKFVDWVPDLSIRLAVAFLILVAGVLVLGAILGYLLYALLEKKGLTNIDRILGVVFGGLRGAILVGMLVFVGELTPLREHDWWRGASLIDNFRVLAEHILAQIPEQVTDKLKQL